MTYMKPIAGHSSAKWIRYYLFKNDRALDRDFLNLTDRDWHGNDWAKVMDKTREVFGNDRPVKTGARVRTYEHIIISLDEKDDWVELDDFRDFVNEWAEKWFDSRGPEGEGIGRFEVAIAYHDDNTAREAADKRGILHAHLVINNTDLETGRRISGLLTTNAVQAMGADIQTMSLSRGWHAFATNGRSCTQAEMDELGLQVSRGKRLNRAMEALGRVLDDEAKGVAEYDDYEEAILERLSERRPVEKMLDETYDPQADTRDQTAPKKPSKDGAKDGFEYVTVRISDGTTMRLIVPHGFGDSDTMAERQVEDREGWSWKEDIRDRVDVALRVSTGPSDFSAKLAELGVRINYNRNGEIVYHHPSDPAARKVKGSTLGKQYSATSIEQAMAEKHASRRQRAQGLSSRGRWMDDGERAAAMAIARAATPCTREGADLMERLKDALGAPGPGASGLAASLGIEVDRPAPARHKPMTVDEVLEAQMDYRDEMGWGGGALNNASAGAAGRQGRPRSDQGGESRARGVSR